MQDNDESLAQALRIRQSRQTLLFYQYHNRKLYAFFSEEGGSTETFSMIITMTMADLDDGFHAIDRFFSDKDKVDDTLG